jgi:hypothetical protein
MFTHGTPFLAGEKYMWERINFSQNINVQFSIGLFVAYSNNVPTFVVPFVDDVMSYGTLQYNLYGLYDYDEFCKYANDTNLVKYLEDNPRKFMGILKNEVDGFPDFTLQKIGKEFVGFHSLLDVLMKMDKVN